MGAIDLASLIFPKGVADSHIDVLARRLVLEVIFRIEEVETLI